MDNFWKLLKSYSGYFTEKLLLLTYHNQELHFHVVSNAFSFLKLNQLI